jgi:hypothetical protein
MNVSKIAALLGSASDDPAVDRELARLGIVDRPEVALDLGDPDGPVIASQDWVTSAALGIEFGFQDSASWQGLNEFEQGRGPMLLTEIYFYGDHEGVRPYVGTLPFGLMLGDDRTIIRSKLASLEDTRRSYVWDTWEAPLFRVTVAYAERGIDFVVCMLREPSLPQLPYALANVPDIDVIVSLLGKDYRDPQLRNIFVPLGLDNHTEEMQEGEGADFRNTYGIELGFGEHSADPSVGAMRLSDVVFYRERELESRGWPGQLPLAIQFGDSVETVSRQVGRPPDEHEDDEFTGYAVWHLADYTLYVYHSLMENLMLRVRIMIAGFWVALAA